MPTRCQGTHRWLQLVLRQRQSHVQLFSQNPSPPAYRRVLQPVTLRCEGYNHTSRPPIVDKPFGPHKLILFPLLARISGHYCVPRETSQITIDYRGNIHPASNCTIARRAFPTVVHLWLPSTSRRRSATVPSEMGLFSDDPRQQPFCFCRPLLLNDSISVASTKLMPVEPFVD